MVLYIKIGCSADNTKSTITSLQCSSKISRFCYCILQSPIPTTKAGVEPTRPGRPVDITSLCRLSPTMMNFVEISWGAQIGKVSV